MPTEGELLDQIRDSFSHWRESDFHLTVGRDVGDAAGQTQGLHQAIMQIDLSNALLTGLGQW